MRSFTSSRPLGGFSSRALQALIAFALMCCAFAAAAEDDPPGRIGRLADTQGQIWMLEGGQDEWVDASRNRPITTGDRLATDKGARLELQIGSTTVHLDESSDLEVRRLDDDAIELVLNQGAASLRVSSPEVARELDLSTHEGRFTARTPGLFRVDAGEQGSFAAVFSGELQFDAADSALTLRAGQRAELWQEGSDASTHYSWTDLISDDFDLWVRRDELQDRQRLAQAPPEQAVSPEMTGAGDLDRYGRWETSPDYGALWVPSAVQVDWAPYRYGRWAWVRPWGWTWVDDAPWGFAPFHYGRWVNARGRWCWSPGQYVARPVYAPALVAWVGGPQLGVSIGVGGAPAVGWVPLAPREAYYPTYRTTNVYITKVNVTNVVIRPGAGLPPRPVVFANRRFSGGVTVVPAQALAQRQPVAKAMRPIDVRDPRIERNIVGQPSSGFVPPPPSGASLAPRTVAPRGTAPVPPPQGFPALRRDNRPDGAGRPVPRGDLPRDDGRRPAPQFDRTPGRVPSRDTAPLPATPNRPLPQATPQPSRPAVPPVVSDPRPEAQPDARPGSRGTPRGPRDADAPGAQAPGTESPRAMPRPSPRQDSRGDLRPDVRAPQPDAPRAEPAAPRPPFNARPVPAPAPVQNPAPAIPPRVQPAPVPVPAPAVRPPEADGGRNRPPVTREQPAPAPQRIAPPAAAVPANPLPQEAVPSPAAPRAPREAAPPREAPRNPPKDPPKDPPKAAPRDNPRDNPGDSRRDPARDGQRDAQRDIQRERQNPLM